jgi:membrane protein implicated in regulation of membrane protease activity
MKATIRVLLVVTVGIISAWLYAAVLQHKELAQTPFDFPMIVAFGAGAIFGGGPHHINGAALIVALSLQFVAFWAIALFVVSKIRRWSARRKIEAKPPND